MQHMNNDKNINFFLKEKEGDHEKDNEEDIQKMMEEFTGLTEPDINSDRKTSVKNGIDLSSNYCIDYNLINSHLNDLNEIIYNMSTVKDLLKICSYYGIDKNIKSSKCKKQDIIYTIAYFESLPENIEIVKQRKKMWEYMRELLHDKKMNQYILWK